MKKTILMLMFSVFASAFAAEAKKPITTQAINRQVNVQSNVPGAQVYIGDRLVLSQTPGIINVEFKGTITPGKDMDAAYADAKKNSSVTLTVVKEGYVPETIVLEPSISYKKIGFAGMYYFDWPTVVNANLTPARHGAYYKDPTIAAGEASNMVSRDNPGQTALERTIIRWYFDSDPQGARIFWRVISSVPYEVKNTNETYLMTTPYEETRSFNILGLTYENSRDVQIEVKVMKNGYEPQVKRFNVRQAIAQQEISSFFMLVKKDE